MGDEAEKLRQTILLAIAEDPSILDDERFIEIVNEMGIDLEESMKLPMDFQKILLKFENRSNNPNPEYAKDGDSGFDLRAYLDKSITLHTLERAIVPTGLFFELPLGFEIQVRPRSGLAANHGITVLNTPGTLDSGYRGELKIILINLSNQPYTVNHGDRIAQAVFAGVIGKQLINFQMVDKISTDTDRGEGGLGHTGK
jgi:dUTP pyrophosphatase